MSCVRVCAITCDCYPDDPLVRRTAEAAASIGCDYHVICSMKDGQKKYEVLNRVHVYRIAIRRIDGKPLGRITCMPFATTVALWTIFALAAFAKIARLHLAHRFDVVHVHNFPDYLVFAALVPKMLGAKVILHVQDVSPELMAVRTKGFFGRVGSALAELQERISVAFADHVVTIGWPLEEVLLKRGIPESKLSSILNSADPKIFREEKRTGPFLGEPSAERPLTLMYHGTCAPRCGLDTAIRALARARQQVPHVRLHLMGGGDALPHLKTLAQELGVADCVTFLPHGPVDAVVDFVADGDIGIIPYRSDGFMDLVLPTKAYEFALMRRPMIASSTAGIRSMFRPSSIILCEPSSVDSFADAIVELYRNPEKRALLTLSAQQDNLKYRWEVMAERYGDLLAALAEKTGPKKLIESH